MKQNKYCLLVEDDQDDQDLFIDALHAVSPKTGCYAVSNGQEALRALIEEGLRPAYIFTDMNMPQMDGLEFLKTLRSMERFRDIPVIVYSSSYSEHLFQKLQALTIIDFHRKTGTRPLKEILKKYFPGPAARQTIL
jgi:CheY-like chemotaxis protein